MAADESHVEWLGLLRGRDRLRKELERIDARLVSLAYGRRKQRKRNSERREGDATPSAPPTALSPVPGETAATDYFAIPPVLDRANWIGGHPPGRA